MEKRPLHNVLSSVHTKQLKDNDLNSASKREKRYKTMYDTGKIGKSCHENV